MRMGTLNGVERAALELVAVGQPLTDRLPAPAANRRARRPAGTSRPRRAGRRSSEASSRSRIHSSARSSVSACHRRGETEVLLELADAVEATCDGTPADQFRVALWRLEAGDRSRPEQNRAAAARALRLWEPVVAERLARAALDAGPGHGSDVRARRRAERPEPRRTRPSPRFDPARSLAGPDRLRASIAADEAGVLSHQLGRLSDAEQVLRETLERVQRPDAREVLEGGRAAIVVSGGFATTGGSRTAHGHRADCRTGRADRERGGRSPRPGRSHRDRSARDRAGVDGRVPDDRAVHPPGPIVGADAERRSRRRAGSCATPGTRTALEDRRGVPTGHLESRARHDPRGAGPARQRKARVVGGGGRFRDRRPWIPAPEPRVLCHGRCARRRRRRFGSAPARRPRRPSPATTACSASTSRGQACGSQQPEARCRPRPRPRSASATRPPTGARVRSKCARSTTSSASGAAGEVVDRLEALTALVDGAFVDSVAAHARALVDDDGAALDAASQTFSSLTFDLYAAEASAAAARAHRRVRQARECIRRARTRT